ncbi:YfhO family protein [Sphingobacterium spiritivorum]|uniref:YfhO family protein n=1 Tax=Sphingobacterium spiritivorum TaxID=258 RepID=UPI003DA1DE65
MKNWFKENAVHFAIVGIFIVMVFFYFTPIWQGKTLAQHDVLQAEASQKELFDYKAKDGHAPNWTNSMFGGMPTYQIWAEHSSNVGTYISRGLKTVFPTPIDVVLLYLLGAYFLFCVLKVRPWLAAVGAIAVAFTSYNFIYIEAGHVNKAYAIAYMAPIIGSVILCYRGKFLLGGAILALSMALEIRVNHIQVTYYLFIALLVLVGIELYHAIKEKRIKGFLQASGVQLTAVILAVLVNASVLYPTYEYSKYSTRGKANIIKVDETNEQKGLDKQYAYDWSQGVGETITFLIPNAYGGRSQGVLDENSHVAKLYESKGASAMQAAQIAKQMPSYWGEKQFTAGPWYFGASILFLFVLGLFIVRGRIKWWILGATALIIFLSFGRHLPFISDLFFDYFPMYNKFRAVESILVIAALLIPILAILCINELINRSSEIKNLDKKVLYTFIGVGGLCLLIALVPDMFLSLRNSKHQDLVEVFTQQIGDRTVANETVTALVKDRASLASKDAWRSFFIVALTFGLIWFYLKKKLNYTVLVVALGVIFLADLWSVDKRYLNDDSFANPSSSRIPEREVDQLIRLDQDPSYRVLDLTTNAFSDATASYFHKNLGGYHAAKMMRFQEILEHQFNGALNEDVLDMFNVRYLITADPSNGAQKVVRRSSAPGNAWFVDKVTFVKDNAQEMQAIGSFDPKKEAFVNQEFKDKIDAGRLGLPVNSSITLTSYHPDTLKYEYTAPNDAFAVFSEVFYDKGWKAYIDGKETQIIRADYILRALQVPGGNHKIEFIFAPESVKTTNILSAIASVILVLGLAGAVWYAVRQDKKKGPESEKPKRTN